MGKFYEYSLFVFVLLYPAFRRSIERENYSRNGPRGRATFAAYGIKQQLHPVGAGPGVAMCAILNMFRDTVVEYSKIRNH